jgi:DNA repair protein SbcD/Mre11
MTDSIRILFLADTHLGFDLPLKPRINRRRRGIDFFKNYERTLQPAFAKKVDLVIHGGDLFYRSRIPNLLISMAFEPLIKIAELGIPVVLVAGNHERSFIQQSMLEIHKNIYVFNELKSFYFKIKNIDVQISGFPSVRKNARSEFSILVKQIELKYGKSSHIHLLCMHQAIEGAKAGIQNYTFQNNHDTIRAKDIPENFAAILSGHIHRRQVLTDGLNGLKMKTPVFYPGSIERTSFAERKETKGFLIIDCIPTITGGMVEKYDFVDFPTRPMQDLKIYANYLSKAELLQLIVKKSKEIKKNCILRINLINNLKIENIEFPRLDEIRNILPSTLNISYKVE